MYNQIEQGLTNWKAQDGKIGFEQLLTDIRDLYTDCTKAYQDVGDLADALKVCSKVSKICTDVELVTERSLICATIERWANDHNSSVRHCLKDSIMAAITGPRRGSDFGYRHISLLSSHLKSALTTSERHYAAGQRLFTDGNTYKNRGEFVRKTVCTPLVKNRPAKRGSYNK